MAMSTEYLNAIADYARNNLLLYIGLVDENGEELSGGDPAYSRQAASWNEPQDGKIQLAEDLTFNVPAGKTVAGFRCYDQATGGTDYGGADLQPETFNRQGTYTLLAAETYIDHDAVT